MTHACLKTNRPSFGLHLSGSRRLNPLNRESHQRFLRAQLSVLRRGQNSRLGLEVELRGSRLPKTSSSMKSVGGVISIQKKTFQKVNAIRAY
jgi:hypothetical protein